MSHQPLNYEVLNVEESKEKNYIKMLLCIQNYKKSLKDKIVKNKLSRVDLFSLLDGSFDEVLTEEEKQKRNTINYRLNNLYGLEGWTLLKKNFIFFITFL
jgi:hypothetical protein